MYQLEKQQQKERSSKHNRCKHAVFIEIILRREKWPIYSTISIQRLGSIYKSTYYQKYAALHRWIFARNYNQKKHKDMERNKPLDPSLMPIHCRRKCLPFFQHSLWDFRCCFHHADDLLFNFPDGIFDRTGF